MKKFKILILVLQTTRKQRSEILILTLVLPTFRIIYKVKLFNVFVICINSENMLKCIHLKRKPEVCNLTTLNELSWLLTFYYSIIYCIQIKVTNFVRGLS